MSLDNIQLHPIVIHDLFKNSLIDLNTAQTVIQSSTAGSFAYLGNNQKHVAIIVHDPASIYLGDDELNFLLGIFAACNLTMADVALINLAKNPSLNYIKIKETIGAEKLILFGQGADTLELPLQFPVYQLQEYNSQVYLCAPHLSVLMADRSEKGKLWTCLKQLFSLG